MPNDPRIKFKKNVYDTSRNLMYQERTGGGGGSFPSGGGGGDGPKPRPAPTPTIYVPPVTPIDPVNPYLPSFPIVPTAPFDPYQRGPKARGEAGRARIELEENARLRVRPIVKTDTIDRGRSGVLDDMLPVADESGTIGASGQFPQAKNQFGLKFKINPIDQPAPAKITKDLVPDMQDKVSQFQRLKDMQNKLTGDLDAVSGDTVAIRVYEMQAAGKSQEYIDTVVKMIRDRQASKAVNPPDLTLEQHIELLELDIRSPNYTAEQVATIKKNIDMLKNQQKADKITQGTKLQQKIDTIIADLAKPNTPAQDQYLRTQKTRAENSLRKLTQDIIDTTRTDLGGPSKPAPAAAAAPAGPAQGLEAQKLELEAKILKNIDTLSKSKNIKQNAQLVRQRKLYEKALAGVEKQIQMRDTHMQNVNKTQGIIDNAKAFQKDMDTLKFIDDTLKDPKTTVAEKIGLNKTKDAINAKLKAQQAPKPAAAPAAKPAAAAKQPLNQTFRDIDPATLERVEKQIKFVDDALATETNPAKIAKLKKNKATFEQVAYELKNGNTTLYDKTFGAADRAGSAPSSSSSIESIRAADRLAGVRDVGGGASSSAGAGTSARPDAAGVPDYFDLPSPRPSQRVQEDFGEEMGSLTAVNHIAEFNDLHEQLIDSLKPYNFEIPEAPDAIKAQGELAVKKFEYERALEFIEEQGLTLNATDVIQGEQRPTGDLKTKDYQLKVLDEFYQRAVTQQASQPSRPSVRPPAGSPSASPPTSPPEYAPSGGVAEGTGAPRAGTSGPPPAAPAPADVMARLDDRLGGTGNSQADSILRTLDDINLRPSPRADGGATPSYSPNSSQRTSQRKQGETQPMEMDTVPLMDSAGGSVRPKGKGKLGKAPTSASGSARPAAPVGPKPTLNFGRGNDVNIQGGRNNLVASEFMNSAATRASSSLRGLASRAPTLKAPSINTIKRVGIEGGKMGAGIVVGIGVSYLMAQYFKAHPATDRYSQIGQEFAVGFSGAAAGNIVMRALAIAGRMGAKKIMTTTGMKILMVESAYATRDAAVFVAIQLGVEIGTEALMDRYKFNHTTSKTTAAVAGSGVAIAMGAKEGGPFGAVLMAAFSAVSVTEAWFEGQEEDRMEEENKRATAETANKVNSARLVLVRNMKLVDNDYDRAFAMLSPTQQKNIYLVGYEGVDNFKNSLTREFNPLEKERNGNPYAPKPPEESPMERGIFQAVDILAIASPAFGLLSYQEHTFQENEAREQAAKDKYYGAYVEWYMSKKDSKNWNSPPPPEDEGFRLLERDTLGSWRTSAEFSGELAYEQTQNYNRIVNTARNQVLDEWRNNTTLIEELQHRDQAGRDLVDTAGLDVDFFKDYQTWVIQDATTQLATQFNHFGTNYRDADQKLVDVAGRDPSVLPALDHYYEVMTKLSTETGLPVAELARLDSLPKDEQERELGKVNSIRERVIREGLNNDKALVDEFNGNLIRDMQSYGENFEAIMNNINTQQMLMGYSYLYGTNRTDFYRQLHLEAPVIVIPPNPYAAGTQFDYDKNRTPGDTLIYGYRYNLTDAQNDELEEYLYYKNREVTPRGQKGVLTTTDAMTKAKEIYDRDIAIYRKSDAEVAKDNSMTLDEYYAIYGYDKGIIAEPEPIEWQDITERPSPPTIINDESNEGAGQRAANAALQASRIAGGGTADEFDRISTSAYQNSQRAGEGGDIPQPGTNENGETIRQENDPDGP